MDGSDLKLFQVKVLKEFDRTAQKNEKEFGILKNFSFRQQDPSILELSRTASHTNGLRTSTSDDSRNSSQSAFPPGDNITTDQEASAQPADQITAQPVDQETQVHVDPEAAETEVPSGELCDRRLIRRDSGSSQGSGSTRSSKMVVAQNEEFNDIRKETLDYLESNGLTFSFLKTSLVEEQTKVQNEHHLFREEGGVGIPMLVYLWNTWEGLSFFREVITPVVIKVSKYDFPLEIDPLRGKKGSLRHNLDLLLPLITEILEGVYRIESFISDKLLDLFKQLNFALSKRFKDVKMGGLICLRLLCPMIISPENFNKDLKFEGFHTKRSLVLIAKVLQRLANTSSTSNGTFEGSVTLADRYLKRNLPRWNAFFHKLMTGEDLVGAKTSIISEVDFVIRSTIDMSPEMKASIEPMIKKQTEVVKDLLNLEQQSGWTCQVKKLYKMYFKIFGETGRVLSKVEYDGFPASVEVVLDWVRKNKWSKQSCPFVEKFEVVDKYSENLRVIRQVFNLNKLLLSKRECICLEYSDLLPEERFGVMVFSSVEHEKCPVVSKYIRSDLFGGILLREKSPGVTNLTFIYHGDAKGWVSSAPQAILKLGAKSDLSGFIKGHGVYKGQGRNRHRLMNDTY
eukprot:TRINITY_DN1315_c0_g1_i3.p1 TRINITY_DN1315_c0_g1~~TRINITY_DN1315_c0_g1_i3.p1  ORF type:complete len:625 (+),score=170.98 TRINITY_DN1315_c0_g1_i3:123-1997(+)